MAMPIWTVKFNTHKNADWSDPAKSASVTVAAPTADEAREIVRSREKHGKRWIGSIHSAERFVIDLR